MLQFRGGRALSPFRLEKLLKEINALNLQVTSIDTEYWHFCSVTRDLLAHELNALKKLLNDDPVLESTQHPGDFFLVLPRPGTISPWSSKATDIAQHCGLDAVERIERGMAFYVQCAEKLSAADKNRLGVLIHDRMTEAVFTSFGDASKLFQHFAPKPLNTIDVLEGDIEALLQANQTMGLALSPDEIEYLAHHFKQMARNPTDVELMMFAQANSEHCRHKIFNADWIVDGKGSSSLRFF